MQSSLTLLSYNLSSNTTRDLSWIAWCVMFDSADVSFLCRMRITVIRGFGLTMILCYHESTCNNEWQYIMWCRELNPIISYFNQNDPCYLWWEKKVCTVSILRPSKTCVAHFTTVCICAFVCAEQHKAGEWDDGKSDGDNLCLVVTVLCPGHSGINCSCLGPDWCKAPLISQLTQRGWRRELRRVDKVQASLSAHSCLSQIAPSHSVSHFHWLSL